MLILPLSIDEENQLIPNNTTIILEFLIWNTLIPSHPKVPDNINISDDNENDEEEEEDDDDLSPVLVESEEANHMCWFSAFQFPCATTWKYRAHREQIIQPNIYCLILFEWISLWFRMIMHVAQLFN